MVSANSYWPDGYANVTITDSGGLTWTLLAQAQSPGYAGVFIAQVPYPPGAIPAPVRAHIPKVFSKGRATSSPGAPVKNPAPGAVFRPRTSPARIRPSLPPRGQVASSSPGAPVENPPGVPTPGGPISLPFSTGRTSWNLGGPVRNPTAGPVFRQAVTPVRAVIPKVFSRGRTAATAVPYVIPPVPPVPPPPPVLWQFLGHNPVYYLDYLDQVTRETLYAVPGGSYAMLPVEGRAGLTIPPPDSQWLAEAPPQDEVPLHRRIFLRMREHIHRSRRRSGYRNPPL